MNQTFVLTGAISNDRTLTLDQPLPLAEGRVRVVVEVLAHEKKPDLIPFMEKMWEEQRLRGHVPRSKEEIDAELQADRDSWDS